MADFGDKGLDESDLFAAAAAEEENPRTDCGASASASRAGREEVAGELLSELGARFAARLAQYWSAQGPWTSAAAGRELLGGGRTTGRKIQELVQLEYGAIADEVYRETGRVFVAGGKGYWTTDDQETVDHYLRTLLSRAACNLDRALALARVTHQPETERALLAARRHVGSLHTAH